MKVTIKDGRMPRMYYSLEPYSDEVHDKYMNIDPQMFQHVSNLITQWEHLQFQLQEAFFAQIQVHKEPTDVEEVKDDSD